MPSSRRPIHAWQKIAIIGGGPGGIHMASRLKQPRDCRLTRFPSSILLPLSFWVPLLKPSSRKKGTLIIKGLLGDVVEGRF